MLVFPAVEVFQWAHAAGVLYLLIDGRTITTRSSARG
jgi:hypothetical protein